MIYLFLAGVFFGAFVSAMRHRDIDAAVVDFSIAGAFWGLAITTGHFFA